MQARKQTQHIHRALLRDMWLQGWSQGELAKLYHVSRDTVSRIIQGK